METVESGIDQAVKLAEGKQTVILALGCNPMINARETIDRTTIALPPDQEKLMEAVYKANPDVVLVLFSNYPYAIGSAQEKLPAILWSATGSQDMGEAMAETIFGQNAPAGRLNMTWYRSDDQLPDIDDYDIIKGKRTYRYFDGETLYPFGYGLTYSNFTYSDLSVELVDQTKLHVTFTVKNTGCRTSDEIAQVYGIAPASRVKKPLKQLLGFQRLKAVAPGESKRVELMIPVEEFRFYDVISRSLMVEEGCYTIYAGPSSAERPLSEKIDIPGRKPGVRDMKKKTAADHYDDYENIVLTEGQFGFPAAVLQNTEQKGMLCYRDCMIEPGTKAVYLHMMSEEGGEAEILINGKSVGSFKGETRTYVQNAHPLMGPMMAKEAEERIATWNPVYADVKIDLANDECGSKEGQSVPVELKIRLAGDVKLCYFYMK